MLSETVSLWPGGPILTLGDYFVYYRYGFSLLFLAWAVSLARWPDRRLLFGGAAALATFAWLGIDWPLGRPYGLSEAHGGLYELAQPMVAAARASASEGWMVGQTNPRPLWSFLLAAISGFDPERLLALYRWVPLASMLWLAAALYWGLSPLRQAGDGSLTPALGVFFVLFLSSHRLSFLGDPGFFWTDVWLRPYFAFALGVFFIWLRLLITARRNGDYVMAGLMLGALAWTELRLGLYALVPAVVWALAAATSGRRWRIFFSLLLGALLIYARSGWAATLPARTGNWDSLAQSFLSVTLDKGLIFLLALAGLDQLWRRADAPAQLYLLLTGSASALWVASSLFADDPGTVHQSLLGHYASLLLVVAAAVGLSRLLLWLEEKVDRAVIPRLGWLAARRTSAIALAGFVALSLPWCWPFWWHPVRMDYEVYTASLPAISRQRVELARWIRRETEKDSVFVAGPSYAPWIAALSGRRVLLAPGDPATPDREARGEATIRFAASREPDVILPTAEQWGLTHLAWGRLDRDVEPAVDLNDFETSPLFSRVHRQRRWVSVFELQQPVRSR